MKNVLPFCQSLLQKVAFDSILFEKELQKAIVWIDDSERPEFMVWCYQNFSDLHITTLNVVFLQSNQHIEGTVKATYLQQKNNWNTVQYVAFLYYAMTIADGAADKVEQELAFERLRYLFSRTNPGLTLDISSLFEHVKKVAAGKSVDELLTEIKELSPRYALANDLRNLVLSDLQQLMEADQVIDLNEKKLLEGIYAHI